MTREDIIRMAREAGYQHPDAVGTCEDFAYFDLERFAALVAAAEREKVASWMIEHSYATGHGDTTEDLLKELEWQIKERIAAEREACARVCEARAQDGNLSNHRRVDADMLADAIRARGN